MFKNKKGIALSQAFGAVLTLVLVGVLVIIGILVFASLNTAFAGTQTISITGEALTPIASVSTAGNCSFGGFSITTATNASGSGINSGNYTTTAAGLVTNTTTMVNANAAPWTLNYSYTWGSDACTASQNMVTQFATYPALVGLVGTIIFLGIVIGVLVASFVFGGKKGGAI